MNGFNLRHLKSCGADVRIASTVIIKHPELVSIGDHVAIDDFTYITTAIEIGSYVHIGPHCSIIGGRDALCCIRDFAGLSAGCRLICASDDYLGSGLTNPLVPAAYRAQVRSSPVVLEKHAVLGTNCVVHPGVTIGEGAAVGSMSLVTRSLAPWYVYMGTPAKPYKKRDASTIVESEEALRRTARLDY
jgi:galactoside O-acetyltransferase